MVVAPNMIIRIRPHLFQSLLPAVGLITEGALELLGHGAAAQVAGAALDVPLAHLLLQVLLQTGFVSELARAVGALQGPVHAVVGRLQVVVEEPFLGEVFVASLADERSLPGVDAVVDIEMGLPGIGLLTDAAHERLFAWKVTTV